MKKNRATAFLFNNCEKLLFRTSHSHAQLESVYSSLQRLRSNRQVGHVYLIHDASSLQVSLLTESNCTYQFLFYFLIVISCSLGRNKLQKLHRFNAAVDGRFIGRGDNVFLGLRKCAAAMHSVE